MLLEDSQPPRSMTAILGEVGWAGNRVPNVGRRARIIEGDAMRLTAGKCYEITGTVLWRVPVGAPRDGALATWCDRRADLWAEVSLIAHVHHTLTAEENDLWSEMDRELDVVNQTIARLRA